MKRGEASDGKDILNLMIPRRKHVPPRQPHDRKNQWMKSHDPRTHSITTVPDQRRKQHQRQRPHPIPPIPARQPRPAHPRYAHLHEVFRELSVADGEDVHGVRVFVVHGVEVGVQRSLGVEGAVDEVEVDVVEEHVEEGVEEEIERVEGGAAVEVGLEEEDEKGGWDGEGEGVDPCAVDSLGGVYWGGSGGRRRYVNMPRLAGSG